MLADLFSLVGIQVSNPYTAKASSRPSFFRKLPYLRYSTDNYERSQYGRGAPIVPSAEELRIVRQVREEYERRGGWARIYPTPDSWALYGGLQEYDSPLNLVLHYHLYPQVPRTNRYGRVAPGRISGVSSSGLASSLERLTCYERALPKGLAFFRNKKNLGKKEDKLPAKDKKQVKASLMRALENGLALSKYQARMAFSVYLQHIQRRLMIGCDEEKQTDLVYRFLKSAARTLHNPLNVQNPSKTLPSEARAVVISKQLGDFIQAYTKETHIYLDQGTSASCSSLSSQCPTSVATSSEPSTPHVSSPPSTSTLSINSPPTCSSMSASTTSINNQASATICGHSAANQESEAEASTSDSVTFKSAMSSVKKSKSFASVSSSPLIAKSHSSVSVSSCSLMNGSKTSVSPPTARRYSSNLSIGSPPSTCMSGSYTSINSPPIIAFSPSSTSINSPPSASAMGSTTSINFQPPSKTPSITSLNSVTDVAVEISTLPPRVRRLKSDGDASGPIIEGDGTKMSTSLDSTDLQKQSGEQTDQQQQDSQGQLQQPNKDEHITMDLYRAFMSNAGESDLEEILALQTRMHNSVGVFLETNRKSRYSVGTGVGTSATTGHPATGTSRPRTPTASPHGSPRRSRRSPSTGSQARQTDPVTIEPQAQTTSQPAQQPETSCKQSSSLSSTTSSTNTTQSSTPATTTASTCCLFGNILKASLKGTHASFIS